MTERVPTCAHLVEALEPVGNVAELRVDFGPILLHLRVCNNGGVGHTYPSRVFKALEEFCDAPTSTCAATNQTGNTHVRDCVWTMVMVVGTSSLARTPCSVPRRGTGRQPVAITRWSVVSERVDRWGGHVAGRLWPRFSTRGAHSELQNYGHLSTRTPITCSATGGSLGGGWRAGPRTAANASSHAHP